LSFGRIGRLAVQAAFDGGDIGSDGGTLLLRRRVDERLGLCRRVAAVLADPRDPSRVRHTQQDMVRQRVFREALNNSFFPSARVPRTSSAVRAEVLGHLEGHGSPARHTAERSSLYLR
jgi:hypothetical protein